MRDEETQGLWDHITGECFEGPLADQRLDFWPVYLTTVAAELAEYPESILLKSDHRSFKAMVMNQVLHARGGKGFIKRESIMLPPRFRRSMHRTIDPRLPEGEQGLGVMNEQDQGKFYPVRTLPKGEVIEDTWQGRPLRIQRGAIDGVPKATWADNGQEPMQLLTRWYGFAFTYPNCDIYEEEAQHDGG